MLYGVQLAKGLLEIEVPIFLIPAILHVVQLVVIEIHANISNYSYVP